MKLTHLGAIATLVICLSATTAFAGPHGVNARQARQQHRIAQGIENGTLTPRESARLERQEARINALEAKDRRSGAGLSPKERRELDRLLKTESHRIYVQKHDRQGK
jgi:hypothetical protein